MLPELLGLFWISPSWLRRGDAWDVAVQVVLPLMAQSRDKTVYVVLLLSIQTFQVCLVLVTQDTMTEVKQENPQQASFT